MSASRGILAMCVSMALFSINDVMRNVTGVSVDDPDGKMQRLTDAFLSANPAC